MTPLEMLSVNTIRILSAEAIQKARSGHPGMPMGAATLAYVLWSRFLKHNPRNPLWPDRDRFVLSAGHGSMLLYCLLHLTGYDLDLDEIRSFRQWGARTAGHPEFGLTPGVEVTTGPLGQGLGHAVGMAMAERYLARRFNRPDHTIVDHRTYAIVGDGDLMEGISHEAASLAGHLKLGKLIVLFDDNRITIEGETSLATSEVTLDRFAAYGWATEAVDGDDADALTEVMERARRNDEQPTLIAARTHIGHGCPQKQDTASAHGAPLGEEALQATREALAWPGEAPFHIPEEVRGHFREAVDRGHAWEEQWRARLEAYASAFPEEFVDWTRWQAGSLPEDWAEILWSLDLGPEPMATRSASGRILNGLAPAVGNLVGGSADLGPSNNTTIASQGAFEPGVVEGPNVHFGVREHAMAAAAGGMALHGGLRPYTGTFLVFSDYMRPSIRLAAMMGIGVTYVFTHDSIGLGEDGPTHQPIEQLASLRAMPGLTVIRPADARETQEAWWVALQRPGPVALILTRQKVSPLSREGLSLPPGWETGPTPPTARGAYVLVREESAAPDVILIATGSEVAVAREACDRLATEGIQARLVSMPSWELFEEQPTEYRDAVLPPQLTARISVEAGSPFGWERYVGPSGTAIGIDRFGASAPAPVLFERFGFTADRLVAEARRLTRA